MRRQDRSPRKMQVQLFKYALLLPLLALTVFSLIIYFYVSDTLIDREHDALSNINSAQSNQIEANLEELDYVTANINYINRLTGFLTDSADWSAEESVRNTVLSIVGSQRKAYQVNLYRLSGEAAEIGIANNSSSAGSGAPAWVSTAQELKGKKLLGAPTYTTQHSYFGQRGWAISVSRAALDSKNRVIGTLEAVGRCEQVFSSAISFSHQPGQTAQLYIFNSSGDQIYPYDITAEERIASRDVFNMTEENPDSPLEFKDPGTGTAYQYVRTQSHYSGWTYIALQPRAVIFLPVYRLIALLACVAAVLVLICTAFAWILARRMVQPLKHLTQVIQRLRLDTLGEIKREGRPVSFEELYELYGEFQKMSESLETSLAELQSSRQLEIKAQMTALQMQMNPHFYYNTLSCISVLAENGQTDDVSSMCRTLSDLMRYITDTNSSEVMLFQEIGIVKKYLYCMKMRYQDSLDVSLEADECLNSIMIPKLILQPLVENAVKYGTDCIPPWKLHIRGVMEDDRWYFTIEDSGNGFSNEALSLLSEQFAAIDRDETAQHAPQHIGGLGMVNVYMRWKLYCRGSEIFEFGNTEDGHARVTIGRRL